ncbi:MAG: hypothetical protein JKY65_29270 [Planctomycetes bacterium]|nr:hypothetical protein [Planctomycetota bacterium]
MSRSIRCLSLLLALLTGCASTRPDVRPLVQGALSWSARSEPIEVQRFRDGCAPYVDEPSLACLQAYAADHLELAHLLFVQEPEGPLRGSLIRALASGEQGALYAESERVRRSAAANHAEARRLLLAAWSRALLEPAEALERAQAARARFAELGDPLLESEAALVAAEAELTLGEAPETDLSSLRLCAPQRVRAALVRAGAAQLSGGDPKPALERARRLAVEHGHSAAQRSLEALRSLGVGKLEGGELRSWLRDLAKTARRRQQPLLAMRNALTALRWSEGESPRAAVEDRLLLAQAYLDAKRRPDALAEAQLAADGAADLEVASLEASGEALVGQVLLASGKNEAALEHFVRAEELFTRSGDAKGRYRQGLNRVVALLRVGGVSEAEQTLKALAGVRLSGRDARGLEHRRAVLLALAGLLRKELSPRDAGDRIETELAAARQTGSYAVLETYRGLPSRLRKGAR